jgi:hypothetical protein
MPPVLYASASGRHSLEALALGVDERDDYGGNTEYLGGEAAESVQTSRFAGFEETGSLKSREPARAC